VPAPARETKLGRAEGAGAGAGAGSSNGANAQLSGEAQKIAQRRAVLLSVAARAVVVGKDASDARARARAHGVRGWIELRRLLVERRGHLAFAVAGRAPAEE
jgi:hypothetical protein